MLLIKKNKPPLKFLVDACIPKRIATLLLTHKKDVKYAGHLDKGIKTKDREINIISVREDRIVITKDYDFVDSFHQCNRPYKLLFISDAGLKRGALEKIFKQLLQNIFLAFETCSLAEIKNGQLIVHN